MPPLEPTRSPDTTSPRLGTYDALVVQGGGVRCLWQAGFLAALTRDSEFRPAGISAVSAGAAIACAFAANRLDAGVEAFREVVSRNRRNVYPSHLFSRKRVFPHAAMYRAVLADVLTEAGMGALQRGPDVNVLLCRPPATFSPLRVTALLLGIGLGRQFPATRISSTLVRSARLSPEFVSVRSCRDAREVAELVLASSSTPPFTPLMAFQGRYSLDGGILESVPMSGLRRPTSRALVLLTSHDGLSRHRDLLPPSPEIVYAAPSRHIEGAPWDYANLLLVDEFYALGQQDGARFADRGA